MAAQCHSVEGGNKEVTPESLLGVGRLVLQHGLD